MPIAGTTKAYRPRPSDFRDAYVRMGFSDDLKEHFRTNIRVLRRWVDEEGYRELHAARREYLRQTKWPNGAPGNRKRPQSFVQAKDQPQRADRPKQQPSDQPAAPQREAPKLGGHFYDFAKRPTVRGPSHAKVKAVAGSKGRRMARMRIARDLADAGGKLAEIAQRMGLHIETVRSYLCEADCPARSSV